jgi:hypothetical protein
LLNAYEEQAALLYGRAVDMGWIAYCSAARSGSYLVLSA